MIAFVSVEAPVKRTRLTGPATGFDGTAATRDGDGSFSSWIKKK
jgi:hypothetical protein